MSRPETVGLVGFGRFGAAFASLCQQEGIPIRAFDPARAVPEPLHVQTLAELAAAADLICIAVPIDRTAAVFREVASVTTSEHVVFDVSSVKVQPAEEMAAVFGARVPWVATHPLFGPASLAGGDRPLRVVVCPNPAHPAAVDRVTALFTRMGCAPMSQTAEAHDQEMALTHALAFFIAKGLLDAGVPMDAPHAPPSFRRLASAIESVQVDAGHLFGPLHRRNPFAGPARARLLDALSSADRLLAAPEPARAEPELQIPDLGVHSPELRATRELIDELDSEILSLLSRRAALARRAAKAKAEQGFGVTDPARESRLLAVRRQRAEELGLDADGVEEIFQAVLRFSRAVQR